MSDESIKENYNEMSLDDVALFAASGSVDAIEYLVEKFKNSIKSRARSYFIPGADNDDLVQEGMIGLINAIRDYDSEKNASFKTFAELCITRRIYSAVKASCAKKHIPLNNYISLYKEIGDADGSEHYLLDELDTNEDIDPMEDMIRQEEIDDASRALSETLSDFEMLVLSHFMEGKDYIQIANELGKTPKSIDNALVRIKQKAASRGIKKQ